MLYAWEESIGDSRSACFHPDCWWRFWIRSGKKCIRFCSWIPPRRDPQKLCPNLCFWNSPAIVSFVLALFPAPVASHNSNTVGVPCYTAFLVKLHLSRHPIQIAIATFLTLVLGSLSCLSLSGLGISSPLSFPAEILARRIDFGQNKVSGEYQIDTLLAVVFFHLLCRAPLRPLSTVFVHTFCCPTLWELLNLRCFNCQHL